MQITTQIITNYERTQRKLHSTKLTQANCLLKSYPS